MSNPWFVEPEEEKIELVWKDGGVERDFWIMVKKRLTIGESRRMLKSISKVASKLKTADREAEAPEAQFDWTEYSFARAMTYMLDWSLCDDKGNKMQLTRGNIESLHQDVFDIIDKAIDQHDTNVADRESKKANAGGPTPKPTSA
jgi:hypothetical protein